MMIVAGQSQSAYFLEEELPATERSNTLSVLVDNEPGTLARVVGLFSGRGYNIESLTVSEIEHASHMSRITIVTTGRPPVISQIMHQLGRLVPVHKVVNLTWAGDALERELALVKVSGKGEIRDEALRLAQAFNARIVDATLDSYVFEITGAPADIDRFVGLMKDCGLVELARTGLAALARGRTGI